MNIVKSFIRQQELSDHSMVYDVVLVGPDGSEIELMCMDEIRAHHLLSVLDVAVINFEVNRGGPR
jgi:hypothetical protein